jgi:flagellin-specific chaperone FliS
MQDSQFARVAESATSIPPVSASKGGGVAELNVPDHYEQLLGKLVRADAELGSADVAGRTTSLEEASGIVFDLLYSLDFKHGGELVPRFAALYGYIGNELLNVGKTRDRAQLAHLRDMIMTLQQSWGDIRDVT